MKESRKKRRIRQRKNKKHPRLNDSGEGPAGGKSMTGRDKTEGEDEEGEGAESGTANKDSGLGSDVRSSGRGDSDEDGQDVESSIYNTSDGSDLVDGDEGSDSHHPG